MPNMNLKKTLMPEQDPIKRSQNFEEVSKGYTIEMAKEEAQRCLNCKTKPCISGCPVNVSIPDFINCIVNEEFEKAYEIITKTNSLPAICGRVCAQENQCESKCIRGIKGEPVAIGNLERFVADWYINNCKSQKFDIKCNNHKVAVLGSGPSGLACAGDLAKLGYKVTIFEALSAPGGVLMYGIPEFRLPKNIVSKEINNLKNMGVEINTNMVIGKILSVDDLISEGYECIYISTGAGLPRFMEIPGEESIGVYSANEFLTRINLMKAYLEDYDTPILKPESIGIVGGGNVAMDAARCAKRLGIKNVYVIYRRSENEMPARLEEVKHAKEEGIEFKFLSNPVKILQDEDGKTKGIECVKMELLENENSKRSQVKEVPNSNFVLKVESVVMAIGSSPNPLIKNTTNGIQVNEEGCIIVDSNTLQTTKECVYAGGDTVTGAATVILAMGAGKQAAKSIDKYIKNKK